MSRKEARKLEAEMRKMGLCEEDGVTADAGTTEEATETDDTDCDCGDCCPTGTTPEAAAEEGDTSGASHHRGGPFGGRRSRGPWGCPGGRGPWAGMGAFGGPRRRHGHGGPMMGPMGWMMGGHGMGPMLGPMGGPGMGAMMGGPGMGPMCGPMGGPGVGPWVHAGVGPSKRKYGFGRFGGPGGFQRGPPPSWCQSEAVEDTEESAEERRARRQKRREERREKRRAENSAPTAAATEPSDEEDTGDEFPAFMPPWVVRMIHMKQRMAKADGPRKEKIRQKMHHLMMKRHMMAQQQQQQQQQQQMGAPWWCQTMGGDAMMGPSFMGPHFGVGAQWMKPHLGHHGGRFGGRMHGPPMWWGSEESDCDNQKDEPQSDAMTVEEETQTKDKVSDAEVKAKGEPDALSSDEDDFELPPHLPPWMVHFIKMRHQKARARGGDVTKKQQRRWARRCGGAPWGAQQGPFSDGAPAFHGHPGHFWAMQHQHRPGMWKKMQQQRRRAAKEAEKAAKETDADTTRCQHCGHCGATN